MKVRAPSLGVVRAAQLAGLRENVNADAQNDKPGASAEPLAPANLTAPEPCRARGP